MKILLLDISGKVTKYSFWVAAALKSFFNVPDDIFLYVPFDEEQERLFSKYNPNLEYHKLFSLIPKKHKRSKSIVKRVFKVIETLLNYLYIIFVIRFRKIDIVHSQFIPFADFINIEYYIFKLIKILSPKTKLILTIHDVLPHDIKPQNIHSYCNRYSKSASVFDYYMVHNNSSKKEVIQYLGFEEERIHIAYHPLFRSEYVIPKPYNLPKNGKLRVIMFGLQTYYKGTDLLVSAVCKMSPQFRERFEFVVIGRISDKYYAPLKEQTATLNFNWIPYFVSEERLDNEINDSNIIILPYRSISQSGVLLLSLYFNKPIITSNLPAFKETLEGYRDEWFFESDDVESLVELLEKIANNEIDLSEQLSVIKQLNIKYSLEAFARRTIDVYKLVVR